MAKQSRAPTLIVLTPSFQPPAQWRRSPVVELAALAWIASLSLAMPAERMMR
jgi:hypothetical protein